MLPLARARTRLAAHGHPPRTLTTPSLQPTARRRPSAEKRTEKTSSGTSLRGRDEGREGSEGLSLKGSMGGGEGGTGARACSGNALDDVALGDRRGHRGRERWRGKVKMGFRNVREPASQHFLTLPSLAAPPSTSPLHFLHTTLFFRPQRRVKWCLPSRGARRRASCVVDVAPPRSEERCSERRPRQGP